MNTAMNESRNELLSYLENMSLFFLGILFFAFPLVFSIQTTDSFILPKEILLGSVVLISFIFFGLRMIVEGKVKIKTTPFDLPIFLFTIILAISSYFSVNRYDALIAFVPTLFAVFAYFISVNTVRGKNATLFLTGTFILGGVLASLTTFLTALNFGVILPKAVTGVLPFLGYLRHDFAQGQFFTPFGSYIDQAVYLAVTGSVALMIALPLFRESKDIAKKDKPFLTIFATAAAMCAVGLVITLYVIFKVKPALLPFSTGFQTAFAAISQDSTRSLMSFLFGSGYGTFATVFTKFKQATFNSYNTLWTLTFFRSSSFVLELLATTGLLGLLSFGLILFRFIRTKVLYLPLVLMFVLAFLLPFTFVTQVLLFLVLAIFSILYSREHQRDFPVLEFFFVALKHGLVTTDDDLPKRQYEEKGAKVLPIIIVVIAAALLGGLTFLSVKYIISDVTFQRSLVAASQNDGLKTYNLQAQAINTFPYRDVYHRYFSQTNLALANSYAGAQPKNASPSAQASQTVINLIQQSISEAKNAAAIAPQTAANWNNLSSIYRSLIGFGQNAESFARDANLQAIQFDGSNPQQYINLGGIYYQLQQWDLAQQAFLTAVNLKPDYSNAHYNLGHAYESKGDLQNALAQYQIVAQLVSADRTNLQKITEEIKAVQDKIGKQAQNSRTQEQTATDQTKEPLSINKPESLLPEQKTKQPIPGITITPTPSTAVSPTPATTVTPAPTK
jgi:tetratricopeptide (TPR) repeat protein